MKWIYFSKLYATKFQAGCLAKDWSRTAGYTDTMSQKKLEVYRSRKGRYGVRFIPEFTP